MIQLSVIGIGVGDPEHMTVRAINSLNRLDAIFIIDKPGEAAELSGFRDEIIARYRTVAPPPRVVRILDPGRDRGAADYESAVRAWREARAEVWERAIARALRSGERGGFLVWGDPALYDGTIAALDEIGRRGRLRLEYEVVPGISSPQALAASHRVPLNRVGSPVQITTGRRLSESIQCADAVVVMLDAECRFADVADPGAEIYWGAYLGTEDELTVSGRVGDVADRIKALRAEARARKGWVMDTYLLRRAGS